MSLLKEHSVGFTIVEYLKTPLNRDEILSLSKKLDLPLSGFVRKNEVDFKENNCTAIIDNDEALAEAMERFPKIMERPIAVKGNNAIIGRPPENVLTLVG